MKLFICLMGMAICLTSCLKKDLYRPKEEQPDTETPPPDNSAEARFVYPFGQEPISYEAEITITLNTAVADNNPSISLAIPPLKFNKSILFMLTQDDCRHSAFCRTWAAIHGRPVTSHSAGQSFYYDIEQLEAGDLPPDTYSFRKTLGSTDGYGNEIRFNFTTTLSPEWDFMSAPVSVLPGFTDNLYRFFMKSGLRWPNVQEMVNYGTGIAFHDVNTTATSDIDSLLQHFPIAQGITKEALQGRGMKFLAEPDGNKTYIDAAMRYDDILTMTAQTGTSKLIPFQVSDDLHKVALHRFFAPSVNTVKNLIREQLQRPVEYREAIHLGVHEMNDEYVQLLLWLNENYGKDGTDELWFPAQEEYYEYNYYRQHSQLSYLQDGNTLKVKIKLPGQRHFYYPSLTLNISGIKPENISAVSSNDVITGLSYGAFQDGISVHIDCRKYLYDLAAHFVNRYTLEPSAIHLADATYFVNMLKESDQKRELLTKIEQAR